VASDFLGGGCRGRAGRGRRCGRGAGWQQPRMGTTTPSAGCVGRADGAGHRAPSGPGGMRVGGGWGRLEQRAGRCGHGQRSWEQRRR
jgi:hypothetical protein